MNPYASSEELLADLHTYTDTVVLSFSRGKDAVAAGIALNRAGFRIIPYYLRLLPELLEFERESLAYYEREFGIKIAVYPHPSLIR